MRYQQGIWQARRLKINEDDEREIERERKGERIYKCELARTPLFLTKKKRMRFNMYIFIYICKGVMISGAFY